MRRSWIFGTVLATMLLVMSNIVLCQEVKLTFINALDSTTSMEEMNLANIFATENPGVKVEFINVPLNDLQTKLLTMHAAGSAPDVIMVHTQWISNLVSAGLLAPLNTYIDKDRNTKWSDILPSLQEAYTVDRDIIAIPYQYAPVSLVYYNVNHWADAGLSTPPQNWSYAQFIQDMKRLIKRNGEQYTRFGFYTYHPLNWLFSWGGTLVDNWKKPTRITFASENARNGLQAYIDLFQAYRIAPSSADYNSWGGGYQQWFASEKISSVYTGLWASYGFGEVGFDWDVTLPPMGTGGSGRGYELAARGYGISSQTKHPDLAYKLAQFLAYDQRAIAARINAPASKGRLQGEMPARLSLAKGNLFATNSFLPRSKQLMIEADPYLWLTPRHKNGMAIANLASNAAGRALSGQVALENALLEAKEQAEALLKE